MRLLEALTVFPVGVARLLKIISYDAGDFFIPDVDTAIAVFGQLELLGVFIYCGVRVAGGT